MMAVEEGVSIAEKVVGGLAALAASFYLVERAIRFNVDLTDRYKGEIERLETKIDELEAREAEHLTKITDLEHRETVQRTQIAHLEEQVERLKSTIDELKATQPKPPVPPTSRTNKPRRPR